MVSAIAQRLDRGALLRWFIAGSTWGLTLAAGLLALNASTCGPPCPGDIAFMATLCIATGLLTIGPFAAFAPRLSDTEIP